MAKLGIALPAEHVIAIFHDAVRRCFLPVGAQERCQDMVAVAHNDDIDRITGRLSGRIRRTTGQFANREAQSLHIDDRHFINGVQPIGIQIRIVRDKPWYTNQKCKRMHLRICQDIDVESLGALTKVSKNES